MSFARAQNMAAPNRLAMAHRIGAPFGMVSLDGAAFAVSINNRPALAFRLRRQTEPGSISVGGENGHATTFSPSGGVIPKVAKQTLLKGRQWRKTGPPHIGWTVLRVATLTE